MLGWVRTHGPSAPGTNWCATCRMASVALSSRSVGAVAVIASSSRDTCAPIREARASSEANRSESNPSEAINQRSSNQR
eukprot:705620-Prymnesium_polylepis.1